MKVDYIDVGSYIRQLRVKRELTQMELARELKVSDSSISNWEKGSSSIEIQSAVDLCELFNISLSELFSQKFREELLNRRYYEIYLSNNEFRWKICINNDTHELNVISHEAHHKQHFWQNYGCYQILTFDDLETAEYFEKKLDDKEFKDIESHKTVTGYESELVSSSISKRIRF